MMKSHFLFTRRQRNGIFLLILVVLAVQAIYYVSDFTKPIDYGNQEEIDAFLKERDSLVKVYEENSKPKIYPFNPNYITDYKGYVLGMNNEEIDRLLKYREQNKWLNSVSEFQKVTLVSDSLLKEISPYFKFPEWTKSSNNKQKTNSFSNNSNYPSEKKDLNLATVGDLQKVRGIGPTLSERIIKFRTKINGFADQVELFEVYGLSAEVIEEIGKHFTIKTPRHIDKIALNSASVNELVQIKYIDYEIAHEIIEERTLRDGFKNFNELLKIKDFPIVKLEIIKLYLTLD
ncbi:ComEA family DNA-binding protein [Mangrovimonas futianensis]|uniref:ComEA family DNA-binding protein n=1 Tax=Mangrovimonas futianensis TaxID=2895523 RepID=UPI001E526099|nr:helix-hairpin-helix domain-containing protein [Mangrovimonas futianensis]MCF1421248.1 helix-hairpin-helix domain-containing protein [Mangrovimonas futianensis]